MNSRELWLRSSTLGAYGHRLCLEISSHRADTVENAIAQIGGPPPGYMDLCYITCYVAVFLLAFQSQYISARQFTYLRSDGFIEHPLLHIYRNEATIESHRLRRQFVEGERVYSLYWFFTRKGRPNFAGRVSHLMYEIDGSWAAGTNNYESSDPEYPQTLFSTQNLNNTLAWSDEEDGWLCPSGGEHCVVDIIKTPTRVLRPPDARRGDA